MSRSAANTIIIIPAHNEAANLSKVLSEIADLGLTHDILVVDDRSTDETAALAARMGARVLSLPCNLGYGGAVQSGFRYAVQYGHDFGLIMDADGQHAAESIPELLRVVQEGGADVAVGSRFLGRMDYQASFAKRAGMAFFSQVVSRITGQPVTDATSGFQAMTREVMAFFAEDNYPVDFPDADTLLLLHFAGFRLREVPVVMRQRLSGESMHSSWKPLYYVSKMFLSIFVVLLRQKTHRNAIRPGGDADGLSVGAQAREGVDTSHA